MNKKEIGARFRLKRLECGLSAKSFALKLGLSKYTIHNIEGGRRGLSMAILIKLYEEFQINPDYILLGIGCNDLTIRTKVVD